METALFDWPIVLQYDIEAKYRLISRTYILGHEVYSAELSLNNQNPPRAFVSVGQTNQIALFPIFVSGQTKIALTRLTSPKGLTRFRQIQKRIC